ncbi:MarR family transcriptional regulator [Streptomyces sp. NPDC057245]|uniref:MarR family transcriptional regulator n=1 Tax=Streptomyces TaxID=1883 RepID=UPI001C1E1BD1|nr:MarR family transcriptional regulator [Streptomyces sp. A108]MBU6533285.1 MarR family transcriptional regulator [Streptomyces sp. A108]
MPGDLWRGDPGTPLRELPYPAGIDQEWVISVTTRPGPSTTLTAHRPVRPGEESGAQSRRPTVRASLGAPASGGRDAAAGTPATARTSARLGPREATEDELMWWQCMEELRCHFERALTRELGRLGLSPSTYLALEQLALSREQLRVAELAQEIHLSPSSTSRVVDRLVRDELAVRMPSTGDRRMVHSRITERGRDLYEAAVPAYRMALADALDAAPGIRGTAGLANGVPGPRT